jgi:hypothetical protein
MPKQFHVITLTHLKLHGIEALFLNSFFAVPAVDL